MTLKQTLRTTTKTINGDSLTPILIFRRLQGERKFLLESSSKQETSGRYSFIGANPRKTYEGNHNILTEIIHATNKTYTYEGELLELLKQVMPRITNNEDFPFTGGAVGYVSYGASLKQTKFTEDELDLPEMLFHIYDTLVIFDHVTDEVTLIHTNIEAVQVEPNLDELVEQILHGEEEEDKEFTLKRFESDFTKEKFEEIVVKAQQYIEQGETEQIVLSRRFTASFGGDPFALYRKLRKQNPSPYMYFLDFDDHYIIGTSPESIVSVKDKRVKTNPIAGTRRRGRTTAEDVELEKELRNNKKELAEHDMLVELGKRDLSTICLPDTIEVTNYLETVRYEHVMHLVSEVEGTLSPVLHPLDALIACTPAGTVVGSPKQRAMEIIDDLETVHRSFYGGAIGYIGFNGNMDFALAIRTMLVKNGKAYVQSGAGIVADSIPAQEFNETTNKAKSLTSIAEGE